MPTASQLVSLTPVFDQFGLIRVGGRLQHASLPEGTKHPIVLSSDSQLFKIVIFDIHKLLLHATTEPTLHTVRAQYHVLRSRSSTNRVIRECFICKLRISQPVSPIMDPLPASRLKTHLPPFTNVGIDFFCPLPVVMLRRSIKRYGVMFTCLDCQALHLELADSVEMDSFINAFFRFVVFRNFATATTEQICWQASKKSTVLSPVGKKPTWSTD